VLLNGQKFDEDLAKKAAEAAFSDAKGKKHNSYKIALGKRVVARALHQAVAMEV
jgi:xanthine dehydrogenase YagS FAD-binding subunit